MYLFMFFIAFFVINIGVLYTFQEKSIVDNPANNKTDFYNTKISFSDYFKGEWNNRKLKLSLDLNKMSFSEKRKFIESKRKQELNLERIQLDNKLKTLVFISDFELYLTHNKIDKSKFSKMREFEDLKLSTQSSILESTERITCLGGSNKL
ncbi:hypothetical protein [Algibacter sp.]|uniref:hypothetical protein n=1 Tax=Algibacter sp. TaxID=1872428 RepID=UPI003C71EA08